MEYLRLWGGKGKYGNLVKGKVSEIAAFDSLSAPLEELERNGCDSVVYSLLLSMQLAEYQHS